MFVIALICTRTKLHFFNLCLLLLFLLQGDFLLNIKDVFAVVHDFTYRRLGIWGNLNQIQCLFLRSFESSLKANYANLTTI